MRINRENYEEFLVDYAEGTLSANMMQEVEKFLLLNPDVQEEFDLFNDSMVETINVSFSEKESLKKIPFEQTTLSSEYFQQLCVAHIEGVIPEQEEIFLNDLVAKDKSKQHELELFKKTKLVVDHFNYNEKLTLKQPEIIHRVNHANFEEYCIACMEGWLDQNGLVALNDFIAENPQMKRELDAYYSTRLQADLSTIYPDKRKIKKFNIFSPTVKKYSSIISSAAAILVLGFMVFYTTTVDDTTQQLVSSVVTNSNDNLNTKEVGLNIADTSSDTKEQKREKKSILHDPFGFEKIKGDINVNASSEIEYQRVALTRVEPIQINEIQCAPCKDAFENRTTVKTSLANIEYTKVNDQLADNSNIKAARKPTDHLLDIAQTGLEGLEKITNTDLVVQKNKKGDKTRIAFNSRYFSFSTQVNKRTN